MKLCSDLVQGNREAMTNIRKEQIDAYDRDGAICIRQMLSREQIETLTAGIELNLRSLSPLANVASEKNDPGYFVEDFCTWQENQFYRHFIFYSQIGRVAGLLMKSNVCRFYHDHLLVKEPGTQQSTPWHQDQPYYNIAGSQNLSMWIPIDPVSRSSTLEFIAGSHKGSWMMPRSFRDNQANWFPDGSLVEIPDIENNRDQFPIVGWELEPGDVVCFHMLTLHSAKGVNETRRRVFSARFLGDNATHEPRPWRTSPPFPGLADELPAGSQFEHALFPILWQSDHL